MFSRGISLKKLYFPAPPSWLHLQMHVGEAGIPQRGLWFPVPMTGLCVDKVVGGGCNIAGWGPVLWSPPSSPPH